MCGLTSQVLAKDFKAGGHPDLISAAKVLQSFWPLRLLYFSVLYCTLLYFILRYFGRNVLDYSVLKKINYYSRGTRAA